MIAEGGFRAASFDPIKWIEGYLDEQGIVNLAAESKRMIADLQWKLRELEGKRRVEFEAEASKLAQTKDCSFTVDGLKQECEETPQRVSNILKSDQISRLLELEQKRNKVRELLAAVKAESEWRQAGHRFTGALESGDLDGAQQELEAMRMVDRRASEIEAMRDRLVQAIRNQ